MLHFFHETETETAEWVLLETAVSRETSADDPPQSDTHPPHFRRFLKPVMPVCGTCAGDAMLMMVEKGLGPLDDAMKPSCKSLAVAGSRLDG